MLVEIELIVEWVVELTWFLNAGRKSLVFGVSMKTDLHFVWLVRIDLISVWEFELDLIPVTHEEYLAVVWVVQNDFISVWRIGVNLFLCSGRKWHSFSVWIEIH